MDFLKQKLTNRVPPSANVESEDANYYAFFDKPSPENLSANRSGILTPQQREALQSHVSNHKASLAIWIGMLIVAALGMVFLFWQIDASDGAISIRDQFLNAAVLFILLCVFAFWFRKEWFIFFMGDDLENAAVQSAVGRIEWSGGHYQMRTDDRLLRSLRAHVAVPPPGDYRFYFLPHTGLVIMAEETRSGTVSDVPELLRVLAEVNNFSLAELKLNRQGLLSKHQENRLLWITALYLVFCIGSVVAFIIFLPKILPTLSSIRNQLILIICVYLLLRFSWSAIRLIGDIWHGKVTSVEGLVSRRIHRSRYTDSYYYVSDPHEFQVSRAAYDALMEGQAYRIYFVPYSRRLVSIEPM